MHARQPSSEPARSCAAPMGTYTNAKLQTSSETHSGPALGLPLSHFKLAGALRRLTANLGSAAWIIASKKCAPFNF